VDPHRLDADPDSTYYSDADPDVDSDFLFDADPDPTFTLMLIRILILASIKAQTLEKVLKIGSYSIH
jgi:hypothetical protein